VLSPQLNAQYASLDRNLSTPASQDMPLCKYVYRAIFSGMTYFALHWTLLRFICL